MKPLAIVFLFLLGTVAPSVRPVRAADPTTWDAAALATLERVAGEIRAAGTGCDRYEPYRVDLIAASYRGRLPLPAAMAGCKSAGGEDLELAAFASVAAKDAYVTAKRDLLCKQAKANGIRFPGFFYVDGGTWILQPDAQGTARRIASALHAEVKNASCD